MRAARRAAGCRPSRRGLRPGEQARAQGRGGHWVLRRPGGCAGAGDPEKGRQVWLGQCVACHNQDPSKDGPVGPAVKGSTPELVEARVLRATYPPGYKPKGESRVMPARPDLVASVPDLAAYLR